MHTAGNLIKPMNKIAEGGYYNVMDIISYQRPLMMITGTRSIGKSTDVAAFCILDFVLNGRGFIYARRRDNEVKKTCKKFFDNADAIINSKSGLEQKINLFYDKGFYYISIDEADKIQCGQIANIAGEESYKSSNLSYANNIIYDEFISKDPTRYLGTKDTPEREYEALLSLYQTVDRDINTPYRNDTRLFLMGNTATVYNPVFLSLNIPDYIKPGARFIRPKNAAWILEQSPLTPPAPQDSFAYRLSTEHNKKYAFENQGDTTTTEFVKKIDVPTTYQYTFVMRGKPFGVRQTVKNDKVFITRNIDSSAPRYSMDAGGFSEDCAALVQNIRSSWQGIFLMNCYASGHLYFDKVQTKYAFLQYFNYAL